jgi:hypothetical protein
MLGTGGAAWLGRGAAALGCFIHGRGRRMLRLCGLRCARGRRRAWIRGTHGRSRRMVPAAPAVGPAPASRTAISLARLSISVAHGPATAGPIGPSNRAHAPNRNVLVFMTFSPGYVRKRCLPYQPRQRTKRSVTRARFGMCFRVDSVRWDMYEYASGFHDSVSHSGGRKRETFIEMRRRRLCVSRRLTSSPTRPETWGPDTTSVSYSCRRSFRRRARLCEQTYAGCRSAPESDLSSRTRSGRRLHREGDGGGGRNSESGLVMEIPRFHKHAPQHAKQTRRGRRGVPQSGREPSHMIARSPPECDPLYCQHLLSRLEWRHRSEARDAPLQVREREERQGRTGREGEKPQAGHRHRALQGAQERQESPEVEEIASERRRAVAARFGAQVRARCGGAENLRHVRMACATVEYSRTQHARARCPNGRKQDWRRTMSDRRHGREAKRSGETDKDKHLEGNLGQKDARLQKEKQTELSHMGQSSRDTSQNRKDD